MPDGSRPARGFLLLAAELGSVPAVFRPKIDQRLYAEHLAQLQRLRGRLYLEDGAIEPWQLTDDGRHCLGTDEISWHLLTMEQGQVMGCARLQFYSPMTTFSQLGVARSPQAHCPAWRSALERSVTAELQRARTERLRFLEAGGWALAPELRFTTEALQIALGSYALGELMGGCLGLSTATVRHNSSSILRRLGGTNFSWEGQALPAYYDPVYRCEMEVVRFDSRLLNPKYRPWVDQIKAALPLAPVLCGTEEVEPISRSILSFANALDLDAARMQPLPI